MIDPFFIEHAPAYRPPSKSELRDKINELIKVVNQQQKDIDKLLDGHPKIKWEE